MKKMYSKKILLVIPLVMLALFSVNGCKQDAISVPSNNFEFSSFGSEDTVDTGILVLSEVKLMLKDIKLNVANSGQDTTNFKVGPYVLYVMPNTGVKFVDDAYIPAGTYDKVRFMVHKLGDTETPLDSDFVDINGRYSVVVRGTYAGVPFTYKSDKSAHQKLTLDNGLVVNVDGKTNVTLRMKPYIWFIENGIYLDPNDPNNRSKIDNNIKDNINNNFKCYKDDNKDGIPD